MIGRAYLWSARQWNGTPAPEAARQWASTHAAILDFAADRHDRVVMVRYEDLATRTTEVLKDLFAWLGVDPSPVDVGTMLTLTSHQVRGNPMRFNRQAVAIDDAWKGHLDDNDLAAFATIAGDLAHRLGDSAAPCRTIGTTDRRCPVSEPGTQAFRSLCRCSEICATRTALMIWCRSSTVARHREIVTTALHAVVMMAADQAQEVLNRTASRHLDPDLDRLIDAWSAQLVFRNRSPHRPAPPQRTSIDRDLNTSE